MLKWVQSGLSSVAGTAEPEYGKDAFHPVTDTIRDGSAGLHRDTTVADLLWRPLDSTSVETQTFYFTDVDNGVVGFAQVIHSNIMSVHTTAQFTFRLHRLDSSRPIWTSTKLSNFKTDGTNFYADFLAIELDQASNSYTIKSSVNEDSLVDLTVKRLAPGIVFGADGVSKYGDDTESPWGTMRHLFWPRCTVEGTITTKTDSIPVRGYTMFVMALQGMKPHHAAKSWNFLNFQSPLYLAVQMEFTTPRSYADTRVNIGVVATDDAILHASIDNVVDHENAKVDEVGWLVPESIAFNYVSAGPDPRTVCSVKGPLATLVERVDVMAEIPQFIKSIVTGVVGTKPYIYQHCNKFSIDFAENALEKLLEGKPSRPLSQQEGVAFSEVTFITE